MNFFLASHKANVGLIILKWVSKFNILKYWDLIYRQNCWVMNFAIKWRALEKKPILICFINSYTREVLIDTDKINS